MFKRFLIIFCLGLIISPNVSANNPFAKSDVITIGNDVKWSLDKEAGLATRSISDSDGNHYHLRFNNRQLELLISQDADGKQPKRFQQLDVKDVRIDGKQSTLFRWCLNNQESHDRFLQQGLAVRNDVCVSDGSKGQFVMQLDKTTLQALQSSKELSIVLKPFRTPLDLQYDNSGFADMVVALNAQPESPVSAVAVSAVSNVKKICLSSPPPKYRSIKPIEYDCSDQQARQSADDRIGNLVSQQKQIEEKQLRLAEEKRQQQLAAAEAERLKQEELRRAEAAAIAASEAKQAEINSEIVAKMVAVCDKFWSKGEHRCYCQKYIDHAPGEIQANSSCQ